MSQTEVHSGPEFAVALRGYERTQVDEYIARLSEWLNEWKERAAAAEAEVVARGQQLEAAKKRLARLDEQAFTSTPASIEALGDRVGVILQTAFDAAESLKAEARGEIDALRREAEAAREAAVRGATNQTEDLLARARGEAERILNAAQVEAERLVHDARATREAMGGEIEEMRAQRGAILAEVGRIHSELAALLGGPGPSAEGASVVVDLREAAAKAGGDTDATEEEPAGVA